MSSDLAKAVAKARVLICVGPGGVGKTTVAAALALGRAMAGTSSLVCTIDPAKRLAQALGLKELGNGDTAIPQAELERASLPATLPLRATMLDMKQSWDALMSRVLSPEVCRKIFASRYYQSLSSSLAGSQEYIAMERVAAFREQSAQSFIVLDTPPAAHALDFLEAPGKMLDVFGTDSAKWLLTPALAAGKFGLSLFNLGGSFAAKALAKFTGVDTLKELADFLLQLRGATTALTERARRVEALLREPTTQFVLVTGPNAERMDELVRLQSLIAERQLSLAAVVVNRVHFPPTSEQRSVALSFGPPLREKVEQALDDATRVAERDERGIAEIKRVCPNVPLVLVPRLDKDIHDLQGLLALSRHLEAGSSTETTATMAFSP